jgi:hypothetical protein
MEGNLFIYFIWKSLLGCLIFTVFDDSWSRISSWSSFQKNAKRNQQQIINAIALRVRYASDRKNKLLWLAFINSMQEFEFFFFCVLRIIVRLYKITLSIKIDEQGALSIFFPLFNPTSYDLFSLFYRVELWL